MKSLEILKKYFGYDAFRSIQKEAIEKVVNAEDLLVVLPTGSGKSLIYQLPTLMLSGVTVVISPLIALMQDQVAALNQNGISAKMLSSINSNEENNQTVNELLSGELKFIYVAPERFTNQYFINLLKNLNINYFVIDEAHCVSEWGHEFRDDYRKLKDIRVNFPNTPITAFTATATPQVQADILKTLSIPKDNLLRTKMKRENLTIKVQKRVGDGKKQIVDFLNQHPDESGIVYCFTRAQTQQLSAYLNTKGFNTKAYHAGLPSAQRDSVFKEFKDDSLKIVVATIAFGMGIDKSNIRFVLHTSMPKTLENYTQEIGRAGRDGLSSNTLLLYSKADEISKKRLIDDLPSGDYKKSNYKKLEQMYRYCVSSKCRHQYIAKYFSDSIEPCNTICDNCLSDEDREYQDITIEAQKLLSAIIRTKESFGQTHVIDILRGSKNKRVLELEHDKLSVYGIGEDLAKEQWSAILDRLLDIEAIVVDGEYRVLKLTPKASQILKKTLKVDIDKSHLSVTKSTKDKPQKDTIVSKNFEILREIRATLAKEQEVPAYIIFSDKTIKEISIKLPTTPEEFLEISGVGEQKLEKYSKPFLKACQEIKESGESQKELSKTYIETLELIEQNQPVKTIAKSRELKETTILSHISTLFENKYITKEQKDTLLKPLQQEFSPEFKEWIKQGLEIEDIKTLREQLAKYSFLFN